MFFSLILNTVLAMKIRNTFVGLHFNLMMTLHVNTPALAFLKNKNLSFSRIVTLCACP